jgi:toxin ParE1/3/4
MPGYRKFPEGSHIIFYKPGTTSVIEVIRILHKSMDAPTQLSGA